VAGNYSYPEHTLNSVADANASTRSPIERNKLLSAPCVSGSSSITNTIGSSAAETAEVAREPSLMLQFPVSHRAI
jgi:hypothetical protein